jgi:hypothetical protein
MKVKIYYISIVDDKGTQLMSRYVDFVCEKDDMQKYVEKIAKRFKVHPDNICIGEFANLKFTCRVHPIRTVNQYNAECDRLQAIERTPDYKANTKLMKEYKALQERIEEYEVRNYYLNVKKINKK